MPKAISGEVAAGQREEGVSKRSARLDLFGFVPFRLNRLAAEVSSALSFEYATRYGLDIPSSFQLLRDSARSNRMSIHRLARAVVASRESPPEITAPRSA